MRAAKVRELDAKANREGSILDAIFGVYARGKLGKGPSCFASLSGFSAGSVRPGEVCACEV